MRDRQLVDNIVNKIFMEDMNLINETKRKNKLKEIYDVVSIQMKSYLLSNKNKFHDCIENAKDSEQMNRMFDGWCPHM